MIEVKPTSYFFSYLSVFSLNAGKNVPGKRRIHTLSTQCAQITIFPLSGDTHIIVLLLAVLQDHKEHILITDGHGED